MSIDIIKINSYNINVERLNTHFGIDVEAEITKSLIEEISMGLRRSICKERLSKIDKIFK